MSSKINLKYHAFISYKWDGHKDKVHALADELSKRLKIWIDKMNIVTGTIIEEINKGLDESLVFVCCVSDGYADFPNSPNCELEFNYAKTIRKEIIFVVFDDLRGYREEDIIQRYKGVGARMAGELHFKYDPDDCSLIVNAISKIINKSEVW